MEKSEIVELVNELYKKKFYKTKLQTLEFLIVDFTCKKQIKISNLMAVQSSMSWEQLEDSLNALRTIDLIIKEVEKRILKFDVK